MSGTRFDSVFTRHKASLLSFQKVFHLQNAFNRHFPNEIGEEIGECGERFSPITVWLSIELKSVCYYIVVTRKNQVVSLWGVLTSILSNTYTVFSVSIVIVFPSGDSVTLFIMLRRMRCGPMISSPTSTRSMNMLIAHAVNEMLKVIGIIRAL